MERESITTMEELAAQTVPSILESHPDGPLMIAGWSLAGVVAIEVAAQLERAGRDVKAVILFDTLSPVRHRQWFSASPRVRQWQLNLIKVRYHVEEALRLARAPVVAIPDQHIPRCAGAGRSTTGSSATPLSASTGNSMCRWTFRQAYGVYAVRYSPAPLRARVIVVRPERQKRGAFFAGDLGWAELGYRVSLLTVPGDHKRMFVPPNATVLAGRLLERIKEPGF